jgi:hypothetical protein
MGKLPCPCLRPLPDVISTRIPEAKFLAFKTRVVQKDGTTLGSAYSVEPRTGKFMGWKLREPTPENPHRVVVEDGKMVEEAFSLDYFDLYCRSCERVFFEFRG